MSTTTSAGGGVKPAPAAREQHKKNILKRLRTREHKALSTIAEEIGGGITVKHLVRAMRELVDEGKAIKHDARVPTYTAPSKTKK